MIGRFRLSLVAYVLVILTFCVGFTPPNNGQPTSMMACTAEQKKATIDTFAKSSRELANDVSLVAKTTGILFQANKISLQTKDKIANALGEVVTFGKKFHAKVEEYALLEKNGQLPSNWLELLQREWRTLFDLYQIVRSEIRGSPSDAAQELTNSAKSLDGHINELDKLILQGGR